MHRRSPFATILFCAALLLSARCGGDDKVPPGSGDQGAGPDQGVSLDLGSRMDEGISRQDQGDLPDLRWWDSSPISANSGAICNASSPCPSAEEECLYFGASNGMCLGQCGHKGQLCPVDDPNTQMSVCSVIGLDGTTWYCGFFCELGGTSYKCPDETSYTCVAAANGVGKFCQPK